MSAAAATAAGNVTRRIDFSVVCIGSKDTGITEMFPVEEDPGVARSGRRGRRPQSRGCAPQRSTAATKSVDSHAGETAGIAGQAAYSTAGESLWAEKILR